MRIGILVAFATFIGKKKGQCITEIMVAQEAYKRGLKATKCALELKNLMRQNAIFQNGTTGFLIIITATITTIITDICRANKHFKNNLDCLGFLIVVLVRFCISGILVCVALSNSPALSCKSIIKNHYPYTPCLKNNIFFPMIAKNKFTKAHQMKQAIQQLIGGGGKIS